MPGSLRRHMHSGADDPDYSGPGCPIRKSQAHRSVTSSPGLIAGSHVLHRLSTPRHPPYALNNLVAPTRPRPSAKGGHQNHAGTHTTATRPDHHMTIQTSSRPGRSRSLGGAIQMDDAMRDNGFMTCQRALPAARTTRATENRDDSRPTGQPLAYAPPPACQSR